MSRILIVEDDNDIAALIAHYLDKSGYSSEIVSDGGRALTVARETPPDLVILDLMLPSLNGLDVCKALRADNRTAALPIIMLTARGEESERILGLDSGADDYVVKPFNPNELMARVRALLRRTAPRQIKERVLRCGPISVDIERHTVTDGGRRCAVDGQGISAASVSAGASRPRAFARSTALRRVGLSISRRHANR